MEQVQNEAKSGRILMTTFNSIYDYVAVLSSQQMC